MNLYDIAIARKLSGGGGGGGTTVEALSVTQNGTYTAPSGKAYSPVTVNVSGGSSDFSTAEVTVTFIDIMPALYCACYNENDNTTIPILREGINNVILYKGSALALLTSPVNNIEVTGNITSGMGITITGDGTITIS